MTGSTNSAPPGYHFNVQVLVSLGLVAVALVIGFRAGIHWERVGRKVDALARVESLPADQAAAPSFDEPAGQQSAAAAGAPASDDPSRARPAS